MVFTEMTDEARARALENQEDVLTDLVRQDAAVYAEATCPRCGGLTQKEIDIRRALQQTRLIPRYSVRCLECHCLFDPWSGMILEMGNLGLVRPDITILDNSD